MLDLWVTMLCISSLTWMSCSSKIFNRAFLRSATLAILALSSIALHAQTVVEPTAYTVTVKYQVTGTALRTTYRLGSKVLVDQIPAPGIPQSVDPASPTRTLYFLDTGQSFTWDPANTQARCARRSFQGDAWLDPFSGAADLAMAEVTQLGSATIRGIATKILVSKTKPGFRLWVDPKTGLMLKAEFTPSGSKKTITYFEVTEMHLEPPSPEKFVVPAHCALDPEAKTDHH